MIYNLRFILNSYSQIFFSKNKIFAVVLLIVSFLDWWMGVAGLVSILTANVLAYVMGYNRQNIRDGIYGFNPLLVGLGISIYFAASWNVLILIVFAAIMTLFISFVLEGVMAKYGLPFLSLPFLFSIWLLTISFSEFNNFGLSFKDLYTANELYAIGGLKLVQAHEWLNNLHFPTGLDIYFKSLGAIFFQYNIFAGILISVGLLLHSRQSFLMSLIGFYVAFYFYRFIGFSDYSVDVSYYGFNFILSAIAIGSYFLIPSFKSLLWTIFAIPVLVLITIGTDKILSYFLLPVYSLPFNIVVLGSIYSLKLRVNYGKGLVLTPVQLKNAEQNAYYYRSRKNDKNNGLFFTLPFFGKWFINQGFDGKYTHKDAWKYAWDFVITDDNQKQFKGTGNFVEDYYCYNKPVLAAGDGTVVEILDGIEDNKIGDVNTKQNWGNTIVIDHGYGIYSQYSHLKAGSVKVSKGMFVKQGQYLANVGNSGRSPYPHLHFQFQVSHQVGSKTLKIPFGNFIEFSDKKPRFFRYDYPAEKQVVSNIEPDQLMMKHFSLVPGDVIDVQYFINDKEENLSIISDIDMFNNTFLRTEKGENFLYFRNEKVIFNALNYIGKRKSPLFDLFRFLYFVPLTYHDNIEFKDTVPVHLEHLNFLRFIQDFFVNFELFLQTEFKLEFLKVDNVNNPQNIDFQVVINHKILNKTIKTQTAIINISANNLSKLEYSYKNRKIKILWQKRR